MARLAFIALGIGILVTLGGVSSAPPMGYLADPDLSEQAHPAAYPAERLPPDRVEIPVLGVAAEVEAVGLDARGRMGVPDGYEEVAWFKLGVTPGEPGNAVLAGHLTTNAGTPAVFWRLRELKPGDEVVVTDSDGRRVFRVVGSKIYDYEDRDALPEIFGPGSTPRLNLITCDGAWIRSAKSYSKRLVVFTELAE